jgi:Leucine-rich repeat (LRR) protein
MIAPPLTQLPQTSLRVLDLASNKISHLQRLETLVSLEELWMNGNQLSSFQELDLLRHNTKLQTLYFEHNPISHDPQYVNKVRVAVAGITQLDALPITAPPIWRKR